MKRIFTNAITCWTVARSRIGHVRGGLSQAAEPEDGGLDVVQVRPNFYMIAGAGGNIGVQIGSDGVVLVNAGAAAATDQVLAALKKLTDLPIRYIIDINADADFVGGNEKLAKAGYTIFTNALGNAAALPGHDQRRRGVDSGASTASCSRMSARDGKAVLSRRRLAHRGVLHTSARRCA